ncbi:MAG: P-type DNA transfer protein VirB5, partial [Glaciimonas sp.]|nr:P-type DNA transfer protein VirB5 [Glaciimonas sp.]
YQQMAQQYTSMNGSRNMGDLVNDPSMRQYLPSNYQSILNNGYGNSGNVRSAATVYDISNTKLGSNTDSAKLFNNSANQAALNRATMEAGYNAAGARFAKIQVLLDKVNTSPDAKDIADLSARIQAEQVMMQNESIKLAMLGQLAQAQKDIAAQQAAEIAIKAAHGTIPRF